jgi:hypothetical protein
VSRRVGEDPIAALQLSGQSSYAAGQHLPLGRFHIVDGDVLMELLWMPGVAPDRRAPRGNALKRGHPARRR